MKWEQSQIIIGGIILVIVAGGIGFWLGRTNAVPAKTTSNPTPNTDLTNASSLGTTSVGSGGDAIKAIDQQRGITVTVGAFTLSKDGWVVIHEDSGGGPGNILGARRFAAGTYDNGVVELLRAAEAGKTYYAMLHRDDGDHTFDHSKDLPVPATDGSPVMVAFKTTAQ